MPRRLHSNLEVVMRLVVMTAIEIADVLSAENNGLIDTAGDDGKLLVVVFCGAFPEIQHHGNSNVSIESLSARLM